MAQSLLPLRPAGTIEINEVISVQLDESQWIYYQGAYPIFQHPASDTRSFRMFTSQLCFHGNCKQVDIISSFHVSKNSVLRNVAKYEREGVEGFYRERKGRGPTVMTEEVKCRAEELLRAGKTRRQTAVELGVEYDTLHKAIARGDVADGKRVDAGREAKGGNEPDQGSGVTTDRSRRSQDDAAAGERMGIGCTREGERVLAAIGELPTGAPARFEQCHDVAYGGLLCALPALSENGLFRHLEVMPVLSGYYTAFHVILLLAYMALGRIRAVEGLQYESPGELGKLLGLDRIPEVRCLRAKLAQLSEGDVPQKWAASLSRMWMEERPEVAGTLYVDGHVRLYHGKLTELPRRYVSRERLCLRGTTDYWVNDVLGRPFFSVERPVDQGMLEVLENDVVPRLVKDVPSQPTKEQFEAGRYLCRFVLVFDREGYSPRFFRRMWVKHRIACITYHKYPKGADVAEAGPSEVEAAMRGAAQPEEKPEHKWPESWFTPTEMTLPNGETVTLKLAEMGSFIGSGATGIWVREVRKLSESGHQTSLISTAYQESGPKTAGLLFARWSQENFFRYMMEHYALDALSEYGTEEFPGTQKPVVNPARRILDGKYRLARARLTQRQARFAGMTLHPETVLDAVPKWEQQKAALLEEIEHLEKEVSSLKDQRLSTPSHVDWNDLEEKDRFERLSPGRKRLMDTVKLIAYRAETAMALLVREKLSHEDDARALLRDLFRSDADIHPDHSAGVLHVRIHTMASPRFNGAIQHLLDHLNSAEFTFPATSLRLQYAIDSGPETANRST